MITEGIKRVLPAMLLAVTPLLTAEQVRADEDRWSGLASCELSAAGGRLTASARCGSFEVPENPADPEGRRIVLKIAILPARAGTPQPDPVIYLAGGPGQSAREVAPMMQRALRDINRHRDLVFLDQRGAGGSNPLDCSFDDQAEIWLEQDLEQTSQQLRACHERWDADVRFYTTAHGAGDIEEMRQRFGIEQLNLMSGSYGTRMAQVYLRQHPDKVRSVVLDAVVPTRLRLGSEHGVVLDRALNRLFDACAQDEQCAGNFPGLHEAFETLKQRYADQQPRISVTHPRTGRAIDLEFTRDVLAAGLRMLAYSPSTQMMIPYLVHEAATTGSPERLASQSMIVTDQMADMIAIGLNFAVGCSEDWPTWPDDIDSTGTLLGDSFTDFYGEVCQWWPAGEIADDFHEPFDSEVPILILSGELDPVTPPEYGEEAAAQFSNSLHLVATGRGHTVITNQCISSIAAEFVRTASVDDLDTGCLDSIGPEPFFLDLLGPSP